MRRKQFRRLYLKKAGTCRVILTVYYTTSCTAVNAYGESGSLGMIIERALGIPCKLAYHVLLGSIHIKADGIVLELPVFQVKRHPAFIVGLLLGSVFLGEQGTRGTSNALSGIR